MTDAGKPTFDLVDEQWLLVRDLRGVTVEMSLVDTLRRAEELAGLAGDVPTQVFALTRLLVAVMHGATRGPVDVDHWERLWRAEQLPADEIESYLEDYRCRFDLFSHERPFFQVAGLQTAKGEVSDLSKLIADVPNGHRFFSNRLGSDLSLSFAEAARWLVHCQAFDPSGIKSGAVGDVRVKGGRGYPIGTGWSGYLGGVLPEGPTLRETLLLNLIPRDFGETARSPGSDRPAWERDPDGPAERDPSRLEPSGPVELFTWQARRMRLVAGGGRVTGVLICNGDRIAPQNRHIAEAHTAWRRSQTQEKKLRSPVPVYMPLEHNPERAVWRGLQALLPNRTAGGERLSPGVIEWLALLTTERLLPQTYPVRIHTIGMTYGSQSSTTAEIVDDTMSLQAVLLAQDAADLRGAAVDSVEAAEKAARAVGSLAANLAEAAGGDPTGPRTRAVEMAYAELDPLFRRWLGGLGPETNALDCQADWHRQARRVIVELGRGLVRRASPSAWAGRIVRQRLMTVAHAELWFHRDLRAALSLAYEKETVNA
jgi:CRISPR system Cascade subunit CasA